ncbi:MAG: histidine kinase [Anaerolineae bacterium]|nr:histidine kinase [Anaerolineae bacterium]
MNSKMKRLFVIIIAGIFMLSMLVFLVLNVGQPSDRLRLKPGTNAISPHGLKITTVFPNSSPLQDGDLVVSIDGRSIVNWAEDLRSFPFAPPDWKQGDEVEYSIEREGGEITADITLGTYPLREIVGENWGSLILASSYLVVGSFVFIRRPDLSQAQVLFIAGAARISAAIWSLGLLPISFASPVILWLYFGATIFSFLLFHILIFHFAAIFPKPLPIIKRHAWLLPAFYLVPGLLSIGEMINQTREAENMLTAITQWGDNIGLFLIFFLLLALFAAIYQYRTAETQKEIDQLRWLLLIGTVVASVTIFIYFLPPIFGGQAADPNFVGIMAASFPFALAIAILRYNLFDIETLLNRTLRYSLLTFLVTAIYTSLIYLLGSIFNARDNFFVSLAATGSIAVAIQPLHSAAQRFVDRMMYGKRTEPIKILEELGEQLQATSSPKAALEEIVNVLAITLKLPYAAIILEGDGGIVASHGESIPETFKFPIIFQSLNVGILEVAPRSTDEEFDESDQSILRQIAMQAGPVAHAIHLTADLQRSRQKLVTAREEERRKLRRNLHDSIGPQLASQTLTLDALEVLFEDDPEAAIDLLHELKKLSSTAIQDIRNLVYELRPPVLDQIGLSGAINEMVAGFRRSGVRFRANIEITYSDLPAAVEVAAYWIVQEALTNVIKHAKAKNCIISIDSTHSPISNELVLVIEDDGNGFDPKARAGVGMQSMRERAEELNGRFEIAKATIGGTQIKAHLPYTVG